MSENNINLSGSERVTFGLRGLYEKYGYSRFKMSKFEEYDLYVRNGDSLISEGVITFTDRGGKLMALKPDVTLSIIKNSREGLKKVYYNENVYRVSKGTDSFKEIMQVGLECMGDVDSFCVCEVVELAALSLQSISQNCVLDISHLGVLYGILDGCDLSSDQRRNLIRCIGEKNSHELEAYCCEYGISSEKADLLLQVSALCGKPDEVLTKLNELLGETTAAKELTELINTLDDNVLSIVNIDMSVVDDVSYYNGIVFKGFLAGVPSCVLSGGQYDRLMRKMGKDGKAVGFAVYLDMLERLCDNQLLTDADVLLIYDPSVPASCVKSVADKLRSEGQSVEVRKDIPANKNYKRIETLGEVKK